MQFPPSPAKNQAVDNLKTQHSAIKLNISIMDDRPQLSELSHSLRNWYRGMKCRLMDFTSEVCPQYFEVAMDYLSQHPIIAILLVAIAVTCIIPVLAILLFIGSSMSVFCLFFFAALGTIIIFASGMLVAWIVFFCTVLIIGLATMVIAWYVFSCFAEYIFSTYEDGVPVSPRTKKK